MGLPALSIDVGASTAKYDASMKKIGDTADEKVSEIEAKFAAFDPQLNTENYTKSLTSMVAGFGVVGVGVAAVFSLVVNLNKSLADMGELADRVGLSTSRLQQLKFGANALGIGDDEFNRSIDQFATNLQNAKFNANDLKRVFDANGVSIKDSNGKLKDTDTLLSSAFDIIRRAPSIQDAIQIGGFLGLSRDMSQSIKQSGDQFLLLASQANAAGAVIDKATIEKAQAFTEEWSKAAAIWGSQMKAAVGNVLPLLNDAVNGAVTLINSVKSVYSFIGAIKDFAVAPNIDTASLNQLNALKTQYEDIKKTLEGGQPLNPIQLFQGSNAQDADHNITVSSVDAMIAKIKARIDVFNKDPKNRLRVTADDNPAPSKNPGPKTDPTHFDREIDQLAKRTATVNADTAATFQNNAAQAQFRAEFQLLTAIMRDGGEVTQSQIDLYEKYRQTMSAQQALEAAGIDLTKLHSAAFLQSSQNIGTATAAYDKARLSLSQINNASQQLGSALSTAFADAILEGKSLNDVLQNLLKTLARSAITGGFGSIFNAPAAGGLSPFASIFKGLFSSSTSFMPTGSNGPTLNDSPWSFPKFAGGTDSAPGGLSEVGEKGPELVDLPAGSQVIPNNMLGRAMGAVSFSPQTTIDARGSNISESQFAAMLEANNRNLMANMPGFFAKFAARFG